MLSKINKRDALNYILHVANQYNISQRALCENITDYSHFNRICNGKEDNISWDLLINISARLGITSKDICDNCLLASINQYNEMWNKLEEARDSHNYAYIKSNIQHYSEMKSRSIYEKQLYFYAKAILLVKIDKNYLGALNLLAQCYRLTNPKFKPPTKRNYKHYSIEEYMPIENELLIYNAILICINLIYNYEIGLVLFSNLFQYARFKNCDAPILSTVYYNIAYNHYMLKDYENCYNTLMDYMDNHSHNDVNKPNNLLFSHYLLVLASYKLQKQEDVDSNIKFIIDYKEIKSELVNNLLIDLESRGIYNFNQSKQIAPC